VRGRMQEALLGAMAGLVVAVAAAVVATAPARRGPPATPEITPVATARVDPGSAPPPLLLGAAYPSPRAAFILGDAGPGADPPLLGCPDTVGMPCADQGFILAATRGGGPWRLAYRGAAGLYHLQAWARGGAVAWGPDALVASTDGATWRRLALPGPGSIASASFTSPSEGWVILLQSVMPPNSLREGLYATADGGRTWREIARTPGYPHPSAGARLIGTFQITAGDLGGGRGWVSGDGGVLSTTADDGRTWTPAPGGGNAHVPTPPVAYSTAAGTVGRFATVTQVQGTADGGRTWKPLGQIGEAVLGVRPGPEGGLWAVGIPSDEADRMTGEPRWACPRTTPFCGPAVWSAGSGGLHWTEHPLPGLHPGAVAPLDATSALVVATGADGRSRVLYTADGGTTWTTTYGAPNAATPGPTRYMGFWGAAAGWAVGLPGDPPALLRTADGGHTWRRTGALPVGTGEVVFPAPGVGWVVTVAGATLQTTDGGRTWHAAPAVPGGPAADIAALPGGGLGDLVHGRTGMSAAFSTDGGATWRPFPVPPGTESLRPSGARTAWALQTYFPGPPAPAPIPIPPPPPDVRLIWTGDGGRTWRTALSLGPDGSTPILAVPAPGVVWLAAQTSAGWHLYRTGDGGARWTRRPLPSSVIAGPYAGESLSAVGAGRAWMLTTTGLWRTTDGGASWSRVSAP